MEVTPDLLHAARNLERNAIEQLLSAFYPAVYRMAAGLLGRTDAAQQVVHLLMSRSLQMLPRWTIDDAPQRWFLHHLILLSREQPVATPADDDPLIVHSTDRSPAYVAFIRALRALPRQQTEAFLLHYGEKFNTRYIGIAMDCSTDAAANHLFAAERALETIAGGSFYAMTARLTQAYAQLAPSEDLVIETVRTAVRRFMWPRRLLSAAAWILTLALCLIFMWAVAQFWPGREG